MHEETDHASTESQRLALEAMSAQLVHKLNSMIREQEERARTFAELHHPTQSTPQQPFTTHSLQEQPRVASQPQAPSPTYTPPPPLPTAQRPPAETLRERLQPRPAVRKPTQAEQPEESNIGMGMVIFALVGIMILIRSCT